MAELRCYFVINVGTLNPSEAAWQSLINEVQQPSYPMCYAIIAAARACQEFLHAHKRSYGVGYVRKNTLAGFEIESSQKTALIAILDAQAILRGCPGATRAELLCVLTGDLHDAGLALGYSEAQADQITITEMTMAGK